MGDFNWGGAGQGLEGSAKVLQGIQTGQKEQEASARAKLKDAINKQKTFNEVARTAIDAARLKSEILQYDPNFDVSQIDQLRMQLTQPLGADQLNAQAQGPSGLNLIAGPAVPGLPEPSIAPQYNPMGIDLTGYKPPSKREQLSIAPRMRAERQAPGAADLFEARQYAQDVRGLEREINSRARQQAGQRAQIINAYGSVRMFEKIKPQLDQETAGLIEEYHNRLITGFESDDPHIRERARNAAPKGFYDQWMKARQYEQSPENKIQRFKESPDDQPIEEAPPDDKQSKNFKNLAPLLQGYAQGQVIKELPREYNPDAIKDFLNKAVAKKQLTQGQANELLQSTNLLRKSLLDQEDEAQREQELERMRQGWEKQTKRQTGSASFPGNIAPRKNQASR